MLSFALDATSSLAVQNLTINLLWDNVSWGLAYVVLGIYLLFRGESSKGHLVGVWIGVAVVLALLAGFGLDLNFTQ